MSLDSVDYDLTGNIGTYWNFHHKVELLAHHGSLQGSMEYGLLVVSGTGPLSHVASRGDQQPFKIRTRETIHVLSSYPNLNCF